VELTQAGDKPSEAAKAIQQRRRDGKKVYRTKKPLGVKSSFSIKETRNRIRGDR
jgi:hypothetical protein